MRSYLISIIILLTTIMIIQLLNFYKVSTDIVKVLEIARGLKW